MGITVALRVEHLSIPNVLPTVSSGEQSKLILVPNLPHTGTVKSTLKAFVKANLFIPEEQQLLVSPVFKKVSDTQSVEEIYKGYTCQVDKEDCDLYVDEDNLTFFCRENGKTFDLPDEGRLDDYNILDKSVVQLKKAPQPLPSKGGRMFVETKDGILPLLGISGLTRVSALKEAIEKHTGISKSQQLLSSIGRVMHDEFYVKDFEGVHAVYEDSIIDLTLSGDKNNEQAHRRILIFVKVVGQEEFSLIVQGRDLVQSVMNMVEARTGIAPWQQRISFSGKTLQDKRTLGEYFICPQCTLQVTLFKSPMKSPFKTGTQPHSSESKGDPSYTPAARKIKMVRTCKGLVVGTMTIPVLTSDTVADLRRKVKRSLKPLAERNFSIGPTRNQVHIDATPLPSPLKPKRLDSFNCESPAAYKLPPPPLDHPSSQCGYETPRAKIPPTPQSCYETPRAKIPPTPQSCYETPRAKIPPTPQSCYETPRARINPSPHIPSSPGPYSCYETPPLIRPRIPSSGQQSSSNQLDSPASSPHSCYETPLLSRPRVGSSPQSSKLSSNQQLHSPNSSSRRGKSARRLLRFGAAGSSESPQRNQVLSTLNENALSYREASMQDKINKALVQIMNAGGAECSPAAAAEKRGIGAWLKQAVRSRGLHYET